jgi:hypothetical protein
MNYKDFFEHMAQAPSDQMDPSMLSIFKALADANPPKADDVLHVIDDCVYASLCSDFCIRVMDTVWRELLKDEGRTVEQGIEAAIWRKEI